MSCMKLSLLSILILNPILLFAQSKAYRVEGRIGIVGSADIAYVRYVVENEKKVYSDSSQIQDGKFCITGAIGRPYYAWLFIGNKAIRFYLESGVTTVVSTDSIQNAVVSGSPMNIDNNKLKAMLKSAEDKMTQLTNEYRAATTEQKKDKDFVERFEKHEEAIVTEQNNIKVQFIKGNPNSMLSLYILQQYTDLVAPEFSEVESMFNQLSNPIKNSKLGKEYSEKLAKIQASSVGAMAPEFTLPDTLGKAISLKSFRGKYVLIDFWASWCVPCRAENPNLVKNFNQYKDKNFTVLSVSLDKSTGKEAWLKAIHRDELNWTHVSELKHWDSEVANQYAVRLIPQNFLINPDGKIIAKNLRGEALSKKLKEILFTKP